MILASLKQEAFLDLLTIKTTDRGDVVEADLGQVKAK